MGLLAQLIKQGMDSDVAKKIVSGELPPEQAAQRMREQNYTPDWYHGSTHDVTDFRGELTSTEGDMGQGIYLSNSAPDVEFNYATEEGADLTSRIERLMETEEIPFDEAKKRIAGETKGVTYPVALDLEDFAELGGRNETRVGDKMPDYRDEAESYIDRKDYDTDADYEDAVNEEIWNLEANDLNHPYVKLQDTLAYYGVDTNKMPPIEMDESTSIGDVYDQIMSLHLEDPDGNYVTAGAALSDWLERIGYKGVLDHTVNAKFGTASGRREPMEGMDEDTIHAIVFPKHEEVMRSQYGAAFDESKKGQRGILNALTPYVVPATGVLGALAAPDDAAASQPLDTSMAGVRRDPYGSEDILKSLATGAGQALARTFTPEGLLAALGQVAGVPEAGRMRDEISRSYVPDYKPKGEMSEEASTLLQMLGGIADPSPF